MVVKNVLNDDWCKWGIILITIVYSYSAICIEKCNEFVFYEK